ncbi:S8 family peptidase [candidate division KSB1 bacterium]|nr:S8 family peptidase [candidate division KSB1 bacterium]
MHFNKKSFAFSVELILLISMQLASPAETESSFYTPGQYRDAIVIPGKIIVKLQPATGKIENSSILQQMNTICSVQNVEPLFRNFVDHSTPERKINDLSRIFKITIADPDDPELACSRISRLPGVVYAEPVLAVRLANAPTLVPNDPFYSRQQHLPQIHAEEAWEIEQGDAQVIIGIIDSGVDWNHPDLAANIWVNDDEVLDGKDSDGNGFIDDIRGWDFVDLDNDNYISGEDGKIADNDPMDFNGHGTHCAGCAAAVTNNSSGVAGVSWNSKIMAIRAGWQGADGKGYTRTDWTALGFRYAAVNGAHVANLSSGTTEYVADAARYAFDMGVVITVSAGNSNDEEAGPLEKGLFALSVAAVDDRDIKASYSSFGEWVKISAPGGDQSAGRAGIYSTYFDDQYASLQGSSMSAPITAGLAALIKSYHPDWGSQEITYQIVETADKIDSLNPGYEGKLGSGRINAYRALTETVSPKPRINLLSYTISDCEAGNADGVVDVGETIYITAEFANYWETATNVVARMELEDWAVTPLSTEASLGVLLGLDAPEHNTVVNSNNPFIFKINTQAFPHRLKATITFESDGYSRSFPITFSINPAVLLVDDDDGTNNVVLYYTEVLDELGVSYDCWACASQGIPTTLVNYSTVIWGCGSTLPTLNTGERQRLTSYLRQGGNLFISGQDIGWDLCDATAEITNEYSRSSGASKDFYKSYLHAQYVVNESNYSQLIGVEGDPIGDDLQFNIHQPMQGASQSPSEVLPINGGVSGFNYLNRNSGLVHFAGGYRLVYLACGGLESIQQSDVRWKLMSRILNWLNDLRFEHTPFKDTESCTEDYQITAKAISQTDSVAEIALFWDTDGTLPYENRIGMSMIDDSTYQAFMPAQSSGTVVDYYIIAATTAGHYNSLEFCTFTIGSDTEKPTFVNSAPLVSTLDKAGPYHYVAEIHDNMGIDTSTVFVHYALKNGLFDSLKMIATAKPDKYQADIPGIAAYGDTIVYYLSATDISTQSNRAVSERYWFVVGIEDFENGLNEWNLTGGWALVKEPIAYSGTYSITESPLGNYNAGLNEILELKAPLDLSQSENAMLYYQTQYCLQPGNAFGYLELSRGDTAAWEVVEPVIKNVNRSWTRIVVPLADYMGLSNVRLRFRMESSAASSGRFDGWYIDDIQIVENLPMEVAEQHPLPEIPQTYTLSQNYPNPFNAVTQIRFGLPAATHVDLSVYNMLGQRVAVLVNDKLSAGYHSFRWRAVDESQQNLASGIYFYQLKSENSTLTRKLLLLR